MGSNSARFAYTAALKEKEGGGMQRRWTDGSKVPGS